MSEHEEARTKRRWTKSTGDAVGTVRVTFALYAPDGTRVRGNRQRSLIVEGSRVSEAHRLTLEALSGIAREAHNAPKTEPLEPSGDNGAERSLEQGKNT